MSEAKMTVQQYLADALGLFVNDPADTDFQKGYESALKEMQAYFGAAAQADDVYRAREEALRQAIFVCGKTAQEVVECAAIFEAFLRNGGALKTSCCEVRSEAAPTPLQDLPVSPIS